MGNASSGKSSAWKQEDYLRPDHEIFSLCDESYNYHFQAVKWSRSGVVENKKRRVFELSGGVLTYFDNSLNQKDNRMSKLLKKKVSFMGSQSLGSMNLAEAEAVADEGKIFVKAGLPSENDLQLEMDPASLHEESETAILKHMHLHIAIATIKKRVEDLICAHEVMEESHHQRIESDATFEVALQAARQVDEMAAMHPSLVTMSKGNGGGLYPALEHMLHIRAIVGLRALEMRNVSPLDGSFLHVRDDFLRAMESSARRPLNEFHFLYRNMEGLVRVYMLRAEAAGDAGDKRLQNRLQDDLLKIYSGGLQETLRREGVTMYASILAENIGRMHWNVNRSRNKAFEALQESRGFARQAAAAGKLSHPMVSYSALRDRIAEIEMLKKEIESS